jgi:hypothetical protein
MQSKDQRRMSAEARKVARAQRSNEDQIRRLDELFGPGLGARKERLRLGDQRVLDENK